MRCPSCGANVNTAYCEYFGAKMPPEVIEKQPINAETVIVNNYYGVQSNSPEEGSNKQFYSNTQREMPPNYGGVAGAGYAAYQANQAVSPKSRIIALLLCIFLGYFGVHRFYVGRIGLGILYLFTFGLLGFGWLVDIVLLLLGRLKDKYGLPVVVW